MYHAKKLFFIFFKKTVDVETFFWQSFSSGENKPRFTMTTKDYRVLEGVEYENTDNEFIIDAGEVSFKVYIFCEFNLAFNYIKGEKETGVDPWCEILWTDTWWPKGRCFQSDKGYPRKGDKRPFDFHGNITIKGMSVSIIDSQRPEDYGNLLFDYDETKEGCSANATRTEVERWMNQTMDGVSLYEKICDEIAQAKEERLTFDLKEEKRIYKKVDIRWGEMALESL